jgi:hypothetical protein
VRRPCASTRSSSAVLVCSRISTRNCRCVGSSGGHAKGAFQRTTPPSTWTWSGPADDTTREGPGSIVVVGGARRRCEHLLVLEICRITKEMLRRCHRKSFAYHFPRTPLTPHIVSISFDMCTVHTCVENGVSGQQKCSQQTKTHARISPFSSCAQAQSRVRIHARTQRVCSEYLGRLSVSLSVSAVSLRCAWQGVVVFTRPVPSRPWPAQCIVLTSITTEFPSRPWPAQCIVLNNTDGHDVVLLSRSFPFTRRWQQGGCSPRPCRGQHLLWWWCWWGQEPKHIAAQQDCALGQSVSSKHACTSLLIRLEAHGKHTRHQEGGHTSAMAWSHSRARARMPTHALTLTHPPPHAANRRIIHARKLTPHACALTLHALRARTHARASCRTRSITARSRASTGGSGVAEWSDIDGDGLDGDDDVDAGDTSGNVNDTQDDDDEPRERCGVCVRVCACVCVYASFLGYECALQ